MKVVSVNVGLPREVSPGKGVVYGLAFGDFDRDGWPRPASVR